MWSTFIFLCSLLSSTNSFQFHSFGKSQSLIAPQQQRWAPLLYSETSSSSSSSTSTANEQQEEDPLGLTVELRRLANAFETIGDDKLRYKQLLYMANQLPALPHPEEVMIPANKVPGCLSAVYIDGTATYDEQKQDMVITFVGDSDGLLTKGLVALLVRGLSGNTAREIQKVNPAFIEKAKISQSLTPGRNNGFLNMLSAMKKKAMQLSEQAKAQQANSESTVASHDSHSTLSSSSSLPSSDRPMYDAILSSLQALKPVTLHLVDKSDQHAGHAGSKGYNGESHFDLEVVAEAFDGLSLVKRHQLIYLLLGDVMPKIHALQIRAFTPQEVNKNNNKG